MDIIFQNGDFFYKIGGFWESLLVGLISAFIGVLSAYILFRRSINYDKKKSHGIEKKENNALLSYINLTIKNISENIIPKSIKAITKVKTQIVKNSAEPINAKIFLSNESNRFLDNTSSLDIFKAYIKKHGISESTINDYQRMFEIIDTYDYLNKINFEELKSNIKTHLDLRDKFISEHIEISNLLYDFTHLNPNNIPNEIKKLVDEFYDKGFIKNKLIDIKYIYENIYGPFRPKFEKYYDHEFIKTLVLKMNMVVHYYIDIVSYAAEIGTMLDDWVNNLKTIKDRLDKDVKI